MFDTKCKNINYDEAMAQARPQQQKTEGYTFQMVPHSLCFVLSKLLLVLTKIALVKSHRLMKHPVEVSVHLLEN